MKIAIGQINTKVGDFSANRELILNAVIAAKQKGAEMIVFPEMAVCGYPPMDLVDHVTFVNENRKALRALQHALPSDIACVVGYVAENPTGVGKLLQNVVSVLLNNEVIHTQAKTLLPTYDVFDEARYFEPASERKIFSYKGERIGIAICEDLWFESDPAAAVRYGIDPVEDYLDQGATLLLAPSASPFYAGKLMVRKAQVQKVCRSSGVPMLYVNSVGGNDNLIFDGSSIFVDSRGKLTHCSVAFGETLDILDTAIEGAEAELQVEKYDEIMNALVLGVRDYMKKCGFSRVHLGLSGGIDSALVAVIAKEAMGPENVDCFALPSRYSSEGSLTDSRKLAENLGVRYDVLPIEEPFTAFLDTLAPVFEGKEPDLTEENIQARIRGILLMAWSNKFNSLLLTTGNKSEIATGYCTLYGDMCGSLAVIGDLFKTEVYELCRFINRVEEIIPDEILTKPPSAELRDNQTDQDSLPPYEIMDGILHHYLLDNKTLSQIIELGFDAELVSRILRLVARSEYKRRQAPPVLKVSPRAFGTGRRMPLARYIYEA